ncbi:F-box/WD repeat-containing protein pof1 [Dendryphion nanum]|uniref:F-box/WD repeat-containing protein pof1 n=1 Tax=Dendryphion nanum TaxID=256645 RepID=A0A9P9D0W3_9PLEO|nr:F-box/WD repeat-containing protein pof1 [Dendryphion nanum]
MDRDDYFSQSDSHSAPGLQIDSDTDMAASASASSSSAAMRAAVFNSPTAHTRKQSRLSRSGAPRPILTPMSPSSSSLPHNLLPSAPASPPTPAPSPTPTARAPDWSTAAEHEDSQIKNTRALFSDMTRDERLRLLGELLNQCDSHELSFVAEFVSPRLKKDPFMVLPTELCLRILECVDDPTTLARASQVSKKWRELVNDDSAWRLLCQKYSYRGLSKEERSEEDDPGDSVESSSSVPRWSEPRATRADDTLMRDQLDGESTSSSTLGENLRTQSLDRGGAKRKISQRRPKATTYRSHFKQRYMVETAWRSGGECDARQITPDQGVVTSLHLTKKYIVVALDNAKIHVFDVNGNHQKTLQGHVMGVWAMVPWGDLLVSGGCDRDVRVWNLATGIPVHVLRGHTSTVRCLKMSDANTAISGSRDTTLRIWDLKKGICKHVLIGHQASVRCLEIHGDIVVSGSYDTTAKIWSISQGKCLRTLTGHFSQIYAVAFDGKKIATGSLDTSVRIWDPTDGKCLAVLQGHTSLVGQLQMREDILVTGGSDGSVRVWNLSDFQTIHRLAAHDNSVTSLQFDNSRIVSGGSDGRVKVWDLKKGTLVRELSNPAEAVWRVVFEEEKCVIMASRSGRTIMEVWSFSPPDEEFEEFRSSSPASMPDHSMDFESRPQSAILPPTNLTLPPITASSLASVAATAAETDEEDGDVAMGEGDAA